MLDSPFTQFMLSINSEGIYSLIKVMLLIGFVIYLIFAAVAVVQVKRMFQTLNTGAQLLLELAGWFHLGISLLALVWAIVVI